MKLDQRRRDALEVGAGKRTAAPVEQVAELAALRRDDP
jgi:hypothetical protein